MTEVNKIPFVSVSYNAPDLVEKLIQSIRNFYTNDIYIIDGSDITIKEEIRSIATKYANVFLKDFDYNIHHGPGLAWFIDNVFDYELALFIDSDMELIKPGLLENLASEITSELYGVGRINKVSRLGFDIVDKDRNEHTTSISYLHPALMLCNLHVARQWPRPVKHGAPMINTMTAIHDSNKSNILKNIDWVGQDIEATIEIPHYVLHVGRGTVLRTGGYHLDEWMQNVHQEILNNRLDEKMNKYDFTNKWFEGAAKANWDLLIPQIKPTKLLEIGSYEGASTCYLIDTLGSNSNIELHCIDTWTGGIEHKEGGTAQADMLAVENRFHKNVHISKSNKMYDIDIKIHKGHSDIELATLLANGYSNYFDFIYIDGSHQAPDVLIDAVLSFKLLRIGGVIVFDDYLWSEESVTNRNINMCPKPAIDAFLNINFNKINIISAPLYQLYTQKISN